MNLHAIAGPIVAAVNPTITGTVQLSQGYTVTPDGTREPLYSSQRAARMQVQALTAKEIAHLDSLNIQGVMRAVYLYDDIEGLDRNRGKGGDLLVFTSRGQVAPETWLIVQVLETWSESGWCKVAVSLQNRS